MQHALEDGRRMSAALTDAQAERSAFSAEEADLRRQICAIRSDMTQAETQRCAARDEVTRARSAHDQMARQLADAQRLAQVRYPRSQ